MNTERGSSLVFALLVLLLIGAFLGAMSTTTTQNLKAAQLSGASAQTFWLAESAVDTAIFKLQARTYWDDCPDGTKTETIPPIPPTEDGEQYPYQNATFTITCGADPLMRVVTGTATVNRPGQLPATRTVEVVLKRPPLNFYGNNAIYSSDEVIFNGNAYEVNGNVLTGCQCQLQNTQNINGQVILDPSANPLPEWPYGSLREGAISQNNLYDAARLATEPLPTSFWYRPPQTLNPDDPGVPNIVYVEAELTIHGNTTIGGLIVVMGGNNAQEDVTVSGNATIDGAIYTRGEVSFDGGGNNRTVNGAIWSGGTTTLNGNITVSYNADYMEAIRRITDVQIKSWRETP